MKHLQLVISVVFLAGGVFQVNAVPVTGRSTGPVNDPAARYHRMEIFSKVTPESLSKTFNFKDGVNIKDTFAKIIVGLSQDPRKDGIYFAMSDAFLWELMEEKIAPEFLDAWMTVCYIINEDRENRAKGKTISVEDVIKDGLKHYYRRELTPEISKTFHGLAPRIGKAMKGDIVAAANIFPDLAKHFDDYEELNTLDHLRKMEILEKTSTELRK